MQTNKKAFTLIELLAVIVILAVIALIATPIVIGIITEAKKQAFKDSVLRVFDAADYYVAQNQLPDFPKEPLSVTKDLLMNPNPFLGGDVLKNDQKTIVVKDTTDGVFCAKGEKTNLKIVKGSCDLLDETPPSDVSILVNNVTTNSITVVANYVELESTIKEIAFSINGGKWIVNENPNQAFHTFSNLNKDTEYSIKVRVTNGNKLSTTSEVTKVRTKNILTPTVTFDAYWKREKEVKIELQEMLENHTYTYQLGNGEVKNIQEPISSITADHNTLIISILDPDNSANNVYYTYQLNIDTKSPIVHLNTLNPTTPNGQNGWFITKPTLSITIDEEQSGVANYQYALSSDSIFYQDWQTVTTTEKLASILFTQKGEKATVKVRATDVAGNVSEEVISSSYAIDFDKPTPPILMGGNASWVSTPLTIGVKTDSTSVSGVSKYQYYVSTSSQNQENGEWKDFENNAKSISLLIEGEHFVFFRAISVSGITGDASLPETLRINTEKIFDKPGDYTFTASSDGYYLLETFGAQGENGGKGGFTSGEIYLRKGDTIRVLVGGSNGYNGGGNGTNHGGGSTTIIYNGTTVITGAGGGGGIGGTDGGNGTGAGGSYQPGYNNASGNAGGNGTSGAGGGSGNIYRECLAYEQLYNSCLTGSNTCQAGYDSYNCSSCYYGSNTCSYGCDSRYDSCKTGSNTCKSGYVNGSYNSCLTGSNTCKGGYNQVYSSCATGSNTCQGGYVNGSCSAYNTCQSSSCGADYNRCKTYGSWSCTTDFITNCRSYTNEYSKATCGGKYADGTTKVTYCSRSCASYYYAYCATSSCGCKSYNQVYNSCATGSNTCKAGYVNGSYNSCLTGSNTCKGGYNQVYSSCATGSNTCQGGYVNYNCSSCYSGSNTCSYGCDSSYNPCKTGSNTCKGGYYNGKCTSESADKSSAGQGGMNFAATTLRNIVKKNGQKTGNGYARISYVQGGM